VVLLSIFGAHLAMPARETEGYGVGLYVIMFAGVSVVFSALAFFGSRRRPKRGELWRASLFSPEIGAYLFVHLFSWAIASAIGGLVLSNLFLGRSSPSTIVLEIFVFIALRLSLIVSTLLLRLKGEAAMKGSGRGF